MIFFTDDELNRIRNTKLFAEVDVGGQPVDDDNSQNDPAGDYTTPEPVNAAGAGDTSGQDNPPPADEGGDNAEADYTADDEGGGDTGTEEEDDAGDADYTAGGDEGGDANAGEGDPEGSGDAGASGGGDDTVTADDARGLENELFKDLTPDQVDLKHKELKRNFSELYDSIANIIDRVNDIPNSEQFTAAIGFVSEQLSNLKQMVADYMNDVYSTKSYMENAMNYNRFLATLNGVKDILVEINKELAQEEGK